MIKYNKFRPSQFDPAGIGLEDRQDWLVVQVYQNRDSDCLERSNFEVVKKDLEKCNDVTKDELDFEVHRFDHWGPGWFEIMIVRPGSQAEKEAEEWSMKKLMRLGRIAIRIRSDWSTFKSIGINLSSEIGWS